jgi:hypothetical protein
VASLPRVSYSLPPLRVRLLCTLQARSLPQRYVVWLANWILHFWIGCLIACDIYACVDDDKLTWFNSSMDGIGYTCGQYQEYLSTRECRFCGVQMEAKQLDLTAPLAFKYVCNLPVSALWVGWLWGGVGGWVGWLWFDCID